ncbi:MAG TPA: hypothetical protein VFW07_19150 [Parafilimonas sp.]|nr:hypothetical protein [Parafilimonas sp.]
MKQAWIEKTEQYFTNEMSAAERALFEQEMAANEELSSYVSLYREIETVMQDDEKNNATEEALKTSLGNLNAFYFSKNVKEDAGLPQDVQENLPKEQKPGISRRGKRKIRYWMLLAVAAVITGIIWISVTWFSSNKQAAPSIAGSEKPGAGTIKTDSLQSHDSSNSAVQNNTDSPARVKQSPARRSKKQEAALFAANFEPDAVPAVTEGPLEDAFTYYADKHYSEAAQEFSTAKLNSETRGLEINPKLIAFYADYYAGISYLEQADNSNAILKLDSAVTKSPGEVFRIKATWYLALAYLKTGELAKANELLAKISQNKTETVYRSKAARLLAALK